MYKNYKTIVTKIMTKIKEGYKVFYFNNGFLTSAVVQFPVYYNKEKTYRKLNCGGLAVFKTKEDAQNFKDIICYRDSIIIKKVRYRGSVHRQLYYENRHGHQICYDGKLPKGTDFADWVQIIG